MKRRDFDVPAMESPKAYQLVTDVVVPRPIAWVSTSDADGHANLAPHSFFTVASANPAIVQFTSVRRKDSLRNIEATKNFVVNFAPRELLEAINTSAATLDPDVDEFELAGVTKEASAVVSAPRVAQAPVAIECELERVVEVGDSFLVLGRVVHISVGEDFLDGDSPMAERLSPVAKMGGSYYSALGEMIHLPRPN